MTQVALKHLPSQPPSTKSVQAGMTSINDFATTYMCQSLPFGGVKESGFDRFAGIEGLRGMCYPKVRVALYLSRWLPRSGCYLLGCVRCSTASRACECYPKVLRGSAFGSVSLLVALIEGST